MANERAAQISAHLNYPKGMFAGQTAIVTGSGQGIGAEAVRLFANEGANVIVSDIDAGRSTRGHRNERPADKALQPRQTRPQRASPTQVDER